MTQLIASNQVTLTNVNDGAKGDTGNGVVSTENYYLVSASKTGITSTTVGWVRDIPQIASPTNKYHWHYHVDIYSNGTRKETIPAIIGIYGDKGSDGNDGISITNTVTSNALATSGTTAPTTGWSETMPTLIKGQFLWTKIELTLSDSTTKTSYSVTYIPTDGVNGKTPVVHTAYANSKNGAVDFSLTDSTNRRFIGQYVDYITTNSTDYKKYKWVDMVGSVSVGGRNYLTKSNLIKDAGGNKLYALSVRDSETPNGFKATGNSTKDATVKLYNVINSDGWWTVSFDIKGSQSLAVNVDVDICDQGQMRIWTNATNTYERKSISVNVTNYSKNPSVYHFVDFASFAFAYFWIDNIKIEKGNIATDYSQAPEDVQSNIDSKADQLLTQDQLNLLLETQNLMTAEMKSKATAEQVDALIASYNKYVSDESVNKANVEAELIANAQRIEAFRKDFDDKMVQLDFVSNYMRVTDLGLEISANDGSSSLLIQKDRISMVSAGKEVMYISQGLIHIDNGVFTKTLQIGNFRESQLDGDSTTNVTIYVG